MFAHRPIRHKLILMLLLLLVFMTAGSLAGLTGVWSYRTTVKSIRNHAGRKAGRENAEALGHKPTGEY